MPIYSKYSPVSGGGGTGGGITSINADTTAAQLIVGGTGISVATALGTTTITNTSPAPATGNLTEAISTILTITGGTGAVIGSGTTIQVAQAGAAQDGFLSSADWNTFNNKQPAGTYVTSVTGSAPVSSTGGTTPAISISQSGVATDGYLSSTDWNTFNNKATYPTQTGNTDKVLATDGTNVSWQFAGLGSGSFASGTVVLGRAKPASLTGADNIIIGDNAGNALSNQTKHIAIGTSALSTFNVSVGNEPNQSVAIGYESLKVINSASQNWGMVAVGYRAGYAATSGDGAVLIGFSAGNNGTSFGRCVYVGRQAGGGGSINTGIGMASLRACTGLSNSALGDSSLSNVSTGGNNIGIGVNAGNSPTGGATLTTGSSNIIIGEQAGVLTASTSNAIALGRASVAGANEFSVGSNAYQINTVLLGQGGASQTTANAVKIQTMRASGGNISMTVGTLTLAGAQGTGTGAGGDVIIATAPAGSSGSSLNAHVERMRVDASGNVGIGTSSPTVKFEVSGDSSLDGALVVNESGADKDTRIEGDVDTNLVFVDASADKVGIGNNTPSAKLDVTGNIIASTDIQSTSQNGGQLAGTRNRIINGAMQIDQRNAGASTTVPSTVSYNTVDRFRVQEDTDGAMTAEQVEDAPDGFYQSLKITTTTADASIGISQFAGLFHYIEGNNVNDLQWGTANAKEITLSFWVKSTLTGTFSGSLRNGSAARSYPFEYSINSANTWEKKSITIPGDTSGTWPNDNTTNTIICWSLGIGFDFWGTAGAWAAGDFLGTVSTAVIGTLNATWQITGVQFEVGPVATSFEWRNYEQELAMCQRYYYRFTPTASAENYGVGYFPNTTTMRNLINFPVAMRDAPTALEQSGTAGDYSVISDTGVTVCTSVPTFNTAGKFNGTITLTATGFTSGEAGFSRAVNTSAYLAWSAEL